VIDDYLRVVKMLLAHPNPREKHPDLCSKPPHWDFEWSKDPAKFKDDMGRWSKVKDKQTLALVELMDSFRKPLRKTEHTTRTGSALGIAANSLRRVLWRFVRDKLEGGIVYDIEATRAGVIELLRRPQAPLELPWTPALVCSVMASELAEAGRDAPYGRNLGDGYDAHETLTHRSGRSLSTGCSIDEAHNARRLEFFTAFRRADPYREAPPAAPSVTTGLAAAVGHARRAAEAAMVTAKVCLGKQLVDPGEQEWFRKIAALISRLIKWGGLLGTSTLIRELTYDESGGTLDPLTFHFWEEASKMGGYGKAEHPALLRTYAASRDEGGFRDTPAPGAPGLVLQPNARKDLLKHVQPSLTKAMEAYHTNFTTALKENFHARQRGWVRWWCETNLPLFHEKGPREQRVHAIVAAINGEACGGTTPPPAAGDFIRLSRERLFGSKPAGDAVGYHGDKPVSHAVKPAVVTKDWLAANPVRFGRLSLPAFAHRFPLHPPPF